MLQKVVSSFAVVLFTLSLAGSVYGEEMTGKITKVGDEGREITVKSKGGKEVTVKISGSRTTLDGIKSRSELKEGQSVTVEHEAGAAKKVKVTK
ncbi:MAG TPA: hypothetical protein VGA01_17935 [Candidatus Binatia bacterium]|nr:hypothetical protein [Verrucomicrobiae bacterium]